MTERPMPPQTTTEPTPWKAYTLTGPQQYYRHEWMEWRKAKDAELAANPEPTFVITQRFIVNPDTETGHVPNGRKCQAPGCTNIFIPPSSTSRTCSVVCANKHAAMKREQAKERYRAKRDAAPKVARICAAPDCTNEFIPNRANHIRCSDACRKKRKTRAQIHLKPRLMTCSECSAVFETTHPTKKTCSTKCSDARGKRLERQSKEGGEG